MMIFYALTRVICILYFVLLTVSCDSHDISNVRNIEKPTLDGLKQVDSHSYYATYNGHDVSQLEIVYRDLQKQGCQQFVFYAGDSSLDNKHWVKGVSPI